MSVTIMCGLLIITFQFDESNLHWIWNGQTQLPIILGILAFIFGVFWFLEQKKLNTKKK